MDVGKAFGNENDTIRIENKSNKNMKQVGRSGCSFGIRNLDDAGGAKRQSIPFTVVSNLKSPKESFESIRSGACIKLELHRTKMVVVSTLLVWLLSSRILLSQMNARLTFRPPQRL